MSSRALQKTKSVLGWQGVSRLFFFEAVLFSPLSPSGVSGPPVSWQSSSVPVWVPTTRGGGSAPSASGPPPATTRPAPRPAASLPALQAPTLRGARMRSTHPPAPAESPRLPIVSWENTAGGFVGRWPAACIPLAFLPTEESRQVVHLMTFATPKRRMILQQCLAKRQFLSGELWEQESP